MKIGARRLLIDLQQVDVDINDDCDDDVDDGDDDDNDANIVIDDGVDDGVDGIDNNDGNSVHIVDCNNDFDDGDDGDNETEAENRISQEAESNQKAIITSCIQKTISIFAFRSDSDEIGTKR